ncbi:hypothetical protein MRX96_056624 [Rhipicephalus microplus]
MASAETVTASDSSMDPEPFLTRDPRTMDWPLAGNKQFLITLFVAYVYIVKVGGPRFMKGRKPYDGIKPLIILYNATMVLLNCYFVVAFLSKSYLGGGYNLFCQGINYEARDEVTMSMLTLCWWYLMVRIADFLDTIFFVLRKKDSHISFLHVVHHILVVFNGWFGLGLRSRRSGRARCNPQQLRARNHVQLLFPVVARPVRAEAPVVEALPHPVPARPVLDDIRAHHDAALHQLRLPEAAHVHHAERGRLLLHHVRTLLPEGLQ